MRIRDWSSDVCSSDLAVDIIHKPAGRRRYGQRDGHKSGQPPPGFLHIGKLTLCARAGLLFWSVVATKATTCLRHASCALVRHRLPGNVLKDLRSEEHTSELQSLMRISYAVFCLQKKTTKPNYHVQHNNRHSRST